MLRFFTVIPGRFARNVFGWQDVLASWFKRGMQLNRIIVVKLELHVLDLRFLLRTGGFLEQK